MVISKLLKDLNNVTSKIRKKLLFLFELILILFQRLRDVKITANSYDELLAMYQAKTLLVEDFEQGDSKEEMELLKELRDCFERGKEVGETYKLVSEFTAYRGGLTDSGIRDWQVSQTQPKNCLTI